VFIDTLNQSFLLCIQISQHGLNRINHLRAGQVDLCFLEPVLFSLSIFFDCFQTANERFKDADVCWFWLPQTWLLGGTKTGEHYAVLFVSFATLTQAFAIAFTMQRIDHAYLCPCLE